jgi:hypothetical protein
MNPTCGDMTCGKVPEPHGQGHKGLGIATGSDSKEREAHALPYTLRWIRARQDLHYRATGIDLGQSATPFTQGRAPDPAAC